MKYVAVLQFDNNRKPEIPSIEFDTRDEAEKTGKDGKAFYEADSYTIKEVNSN